MKAIKSIFAVLTFVAIIGLLIGAAKMNSNSDAKPGINNPEWLTDIYYGMYPVGGFHIETTAEKTALTRYIRCDNEKNVTKYYGQSIDWDTKYVTFYDKDMNEIGTVNTTIRTQRLNK